MKIGKKENGTMMPLGLKGKILGQQGRLRMGG